MCQKEHINKICSCICAGSRGEIRIYEVGEHYSFHTCQQWGNNNILVMLLQEVHNFDIMEMWECETSF